MIRKWLGKGIVGVGQRRGLLIPGEILVLVYNPRDDKTITVQSMRGFSIFVRFKEKVNCGGLSLKELRRRGMEEDRRDLGLWRIFFRYDSRKKSKRKGALIQAVEAVERHLAEKSAAAEKTAVEKPWQTDQPARVVTAEEEKTDKAAISGLDSPSSPDSSSNPGNLNSLGSLTSLNWTDVHKANTLPEKEDVGQY